MGRAGLNRKTALATATVTLAAEAPDIDVLGEFRNSVFGFEHHRGFTHSFLGLVPVCALVIGIMYAIWRLRGRKLKDPKLPPRWGLLFFYAYLAGLSHILLDYTNSYGVRPFWPFYERWFSWDIVFIIEPVLYALLLAGLLLPGLSSLINEEIGARRKGPQGRLAATVALIGVVAFWGVRDYEHRRAVNALRARTYEGQDPLRVSAYSVWGNPFEWNGVVETAGFFALMHVNSASPEVDPDDRMQIRYKPAETAVTLAAKKSNLGRIYLDWAAYPVTESQPLDSAETGYRVRFYDLRYQDVSHSIGRSLGASVILDDKLNVVAEGFGTRIFRVGPRQSATSGDAPRLLPGRAARLTLPRSRATIIND